MSRLFLSNKKKSFFPDGVYFFDVSEFVICRTANCTIFYGLFCAKSRNSKKCEILAFFGVIWGDFSLFQKIDCRNDCILMCSQCVFILCSSYAHLMFAGKTG